MAAIDKQYHELLETILRDGFDYDDPNRVGVKRKQILDYKFKYKMSHGFPLLTTKKMFTKGIIGELLWFLRGDTDVNYLVDNGINIWSKDAYNHYIKHNPKDKDLPYHEFIEQVKNGVIMDLGPIYGAQWRGFNGLLMDEFAQVDQIDKLIKDLIETPMGTKHMVTAWNPAEIEDMALPPCHWAFEILVRPCESPINEVYERSGITNYPRYRFSLKWHQRSVDTFLGLPFNIASYAYLMEVISIKTGYIPEYLIGDLSNVHIYHNHLDAVKEQLSRDCFKYDSCAVGHIIPREGTNFDKVEISDFSLVDYESYPPIKAEMLAYNKKKNE